MKALSRKSETVKKTHELCFLKLCEVIGQRIKIGNEMIKLTDLRDMYIELLSKTAFANRNHRTKRLKIRLERHAVYSEKLTIVSIDRKCGMLQSSLVFSNDLDIVTAVRKTCCLHRTSLDQIDDIAILLCQIVKDAFSNLVICPGHLL